MLSDMATIFCSQHRANMRAIRFNMENNLFLRRWIFCAEILGKQDPKMLSEMSSKRTVRSGTHFPRSKK